MKLVYWIGVYTICVTAYKVKNATMKALIEWMDEREESKEQKKREKELEDHPHVFKAKAMKMRIGF